MPQPPAFRELISFLRAARNLWGRCPRCGEPFRLSDACIAATTDAPSDWLRKHQRARDILESRRADLDQQSAEIAAQERDIQERERDLDMRERNLDRDARVRAQEMLKADPQMRKLLTEERRNAVQRSRSTLLGHLFERLGPFMQKFKKHDPRDIRPLMNPCDYVCFDGLTVNRRVELITFIEVKCGTASPSSTQRSIEKAVREHRVTTETWDFGERGIPIAQQLLPARPTRKALPPG